MHIGAPQHELEVKEFGNDSFPKVILDIKMTEKLLSLRVGRGRLP
jgi:hypothetical protein